MNAMERRSWSLCGRAGVACCVVAGLFGAAIAAPPRKPPKRPVVKTPAAPASGRVHIVSNVDGTSCTMDGTPCVFEADGKTLSTTPGEHTIELTKDQFQSAKVVFKVQPGTDQDVAFDLKPSTAVAPVKLEVPVELARRAPTLTAVRIGHPPDIDGRIDDEAWQQASVERSFTQNYPNEGQAPTERTELRVVYDDDAIYVAVKCHDSQPEKMVARLTRRDRDIDGDKISVDISSNNDKASAYHFQVNAAGVQVDGIRFGDTDYGSDWDGRWYSATSRDKEGWIAELKIPLVTLRYSGDVSSFGYQVRRWLGRSGEIDEWAYVPRTAKGEVSYYGSVAGITGLNAKRLKEILVYDARTYTSRTKQGAFDGDITGGSIGADWKLGLTSALTLNGTINPDFGTVEVDQVVLNLSTVETYFPEKRPFFLEGADLLATPFTLFYSRRVGSHPPDPTLGAGAEQVEPLPEGRIWSALKMTGVLHGRLSIALLDAVTGREDAKITRVPTGDRMTEELLVEPLSNFGVLRLRQDFGTNSSIGLLGTTLNRFEPAGAAAPLAGDLCPVPYSTNFTFLNPPAPFKGRCTNDAYTGGIDTVLRTSDGEWGASAQVVGSRVQNGPTRIIPDGTQIGSGATGWGMTAEVGRYGGDHWLYKLGYKNSTPRLQLNDSGFQSQANFHDAVASLRWRTTKPSKHFLSAWVEAKLKHRRDWKLRDNLGTEPTIDATLELSNFWTVSTTLSPYYPNWVENRETQDGARTERSGGYYYAMHVKSDPKRQLVLELSGGWNRSFDGLNGIFGSATLSLRPIPALELDLISNLGWWYGNPRWVDTVLNMDGSNTYFFSDLDAKSVDVTLRGTYTFTRKLSLQAYLQPFIASGHRSKVTSSTQSGSEPFLSLDSFVDATLPVRDFRGGSINLNLFARWEYLPLSALWLVYTHNQGQTRYDPLEGEGRLRFYPFLDGPTTDVVLVKLSYLWF